MSRQAQGKRARLLFEAIQILMELYQDMVVPCVELKFVQPNKKDEE